MSVVNFTTRNNFLRVYFDTDWEGDEEEEFFEFTINHCDLNLFLAKNLKLEEDRIRRILDRYNFSGDNVDHIFNYLTTDWNWRDKETYNITLE